MLFQSPDIPWGLSALLLSGSSQTEVQAPRRQAQVSKGGSTRGGERFIGPPVDFETALVV